jgi:hypothetical protein
MEVSEFGEIGDERGGDDAAHSWNGLDEFGLLPPVTVGLDKRWQPTLFPAGRLLIVSQ